MSGLLTAGQMIAVHARVTPEKIGAADSTRALTFRQWNERACRLANALLAGGLAKGERVAILAYNCVEWMEIYVALAKAGLVAVPVNFRLTPHEILYIAQDCEVRAFIVQHALADRLEAISADLGLPDERIVHFGAPRAPAGWRSYERLIESGSPAEPGVDVRPNELWALMYTSGTTGKPKGAARTHEGSALIALVSDLDMGLSRADTGLFVMPMCHANSLYFSFALAYAGATCVVHDRSSFNPEEVLRTMSHRQVSFTSMVPTQYTMLLDLPAAIWKQHSVDCVRRLMISSAPARRETKLAIMESFANSKLFELYGSTEAGWVTLLRPDEQLTKLGSVGREWTGTGPVRLLDDAGNDVPDGEVGELYSRTPFTFTHYWNQPEKTAQAFRGDYCTVGDMARRDEDGYYYLVDRKNNMIITGGENVYPSEVESVLATHPKVFDVAAVGVPDDLWGERVHAVLVLREGETATEGEILEWCRGRLAGYRRPRSVSFMREDEMPRTATGKIQHRVLRERVRR